MSTVIEEPANHLLPGDVIRRGVGLFVLSRVEVSFDTAVAFGQRLTGNKPAGAVERFEFPSGEILRRVPDARDRQGLAGSVSV